MDLPDKSKATMPLNDALGCMDLIDIYTTFCAKAAEYIFSSAHGTFMKIDHVLGHNKT